MASHHNLWGLHPKTGQPSPFISHIRTDERAYWMTKALEEGWTSLAWGPWQDPTKENEPKEPKLLTATVKPAKKMRPLVWGIDPISQKAKVYAMRIGEGESIGLIMKEAIEIGWTHVRPGQWEDDGSREMGEK